MGRYESELRAIVEAEPWSIPEMKRLRDSLDALSRAVPIALQPEGWVGETAEKAARIAVRVSKRFSRMVLLLDEAAAVIQAANHSSNMAAESLGALPSAKIDPFWRTAADIATAASLRGLELPVEGAVAFFEGFLAQDREEEARKALEELRLNEYTQRARDVRQGLRIEDETEDEHKDGDDWPLPPDFEAIYEPAVTTTGGVFPGPAGAGASRYGEPEYTVRPGILHSEVGGQPGDGDLSENDGISVDGSTTGSFPGTGLGQGGGILPGRGGGGLLTGVIGGGAGAVALGVGSKLATSGFAGAGGGGLSAGAGSGGRTGAGGILGSQRVAPGAPAAASGAGLPASSGRGGAGMMGGGMGGGASAEKEKRSGLGGLIAPKLEDEQDAAPRSAGAGAGGRTPRPESEGN